MSLFAESSRWPAAFDNRDVFGFDNLNGSSLGDFHPGSIFSNKSTFEDPFFAKMKLKSGSTLAERGFYDHFDSIFHDFASPYRNKRYDLRENSKRNSQGSGKEYVIPIRIETSTDDKPRRNGSSSSSTSKDSAPSKESDSGRVIHIPILRETPSSQSENGRDKSGSPSVASTLKPLREFSLISPTTEQFRNSRNSANDVCLDSDHFFNNSRSSPPSKLQKIDDNDIIEIKDEEENILRRRPLRHKSAKLTISPTNPERHDLRPSSTEIEATNNASSNAIEVCLNDVIPKEKTDRHREAGKVEEEEKIWKCSEHGSTSITQPPSYPIYDQLKPKMACIGLQIDYIRGDGNCFFRALSKEMYNTEGYHLEFRESVCDVILNQPAIFSQYIDTSSLTDHVRHMRKTGTWATTCEIYAAANLLGRDIYVLAPTPAGALEPVVSEYNWLLFSPRSGASSSNCSLRAGGKASHGGGGGGTSHDDVHPTYLTLCNTNGNHYDRITPVYARCNCEMPPPNLNGISLLMDLTESDEENMPSDD